MRRRGVQGRRALRARPRKGNRRARAPRFTRMAPREGADVRFTRHGLQAAV